MKDIIETVVVVVAVVAAVTWVVYMGLPAKG